MARVVALSLLFTVFAVTETTSPNSRDLVRAKQWTPRAAYRGAATLQSANAQLNVHLVKHPNITTKRCEEFDTLEIRSLLRHLFLHASLELRAIYSKMDGRHAQYTSIAEMEADWSLLNINDARSRDAHCHEAVMWYVHHLTSAEQKNVRASYVLPLLPSTDHRVHKRSVGDHVGRFYDSKVTCQDCHIGGMGARDGPPLPPPPPPPKNARDRSRWCDSNFKELYGISCGPCDGIDGLASGDADKFYNQTDCHIVAYPEEVKASKRVQAAFPEMFSVEVVGSSDHFGGIDEKSPRLYSISHGKMYGDVRSDSDVWLLRHDTVFTSIVQNGRPIAVDSPQTASIHAQTMKQRQEGSPGAQVSLSQGIPKWMWPHQTAECSCSEDVVGIPTFQTLKELQYMGRIRLPDIEFLGGLRELDHWANWFFHIFMDTNSSLSHYGKAPSRISDSSIGTPKTGFSVYGQWSFSNPIVEDPAVWYRGLPIESHAVNSSRCVNADGSRVCADISQSTFPPKEMEAITNYV